MNASLHLAGGAAMGILAQSSLPSNSSSMERVGVSFVAGFLSHILLDAFPHQEYNLRDLKLGFVLFFEIAAMLVLLLSVKSSPLNNLIVFFGMLGGAIPDVIELAHAYVFNWSWLEKLGSKIHFYHGAIPVGFEVNFYLQFLLALGAVVFVRSRPVL